MAHAFANRILLGLVVLVVVSLPFVFHAVLDGSEDTSGPGAAPLLAAAIVDPYVASANDQAVAEGRATTLADVAAGLPAAGSSASSPEGEATGLSAVAPTFVVSDDHITATVTALGAPVTCTITIAAGKAVDYC